MREGLKRRLDAYTDPSSHDKSQGLWRHKPGSQNHKKSYGSRRNKRY